MRIGEAGAATALGRAAAMLTARRRLPNPDPITVMLSAGLGVTQLDCIATPAAIGTASRFLVVFLRPQRLDPDSRQRLFAHFRLSRAQAELLAALVAGESPREYGAQRGLSPNTVKSHLAEVFRKTGPRRQAELLLLVGRHG